MAFSLPVSLLTLLRSSFTKANVFGPKAPNVSVATGVKRYAWSRLAYLLTFLSSAEAVTLPAAHTLLQSNLNWSDHYDFFNRSKRYKSLGLLRQSFSVLDSVHTKRKLYISLVHSQLTLQSTLESSSYQRDVIKSKS